MTDDRCVCGHDGEQHVTVFAVRSDSGLPCWLCECGRYRTSGWQDDGGKERVWDGINDRIHSEPAEVHEWASVDWEPAESGRHWFGGLPDDCA